MKHWSYIIALMLAVVSGAVNPVWAANAPATLQQLKVQPPQISSVTLNPSSVIGAVTLQSLGTVTLTQPAPTGGVPVTFRSSSPTVAAVPQGVVVQPGAASATFVVQVQTQSVVTNPNVVAPPPSVQISAQIGNSTPVIAQFTVIPPTLTALTLSPASVSGGGSGSTGSVTISAPAPSGGIIVTLSSESGATTSTTLQPGLRANIIAQNPVTVPQQVTIAAGSASAAFPITTRPVSASTTFQITAAQGIYIKKTAALTLLPPALASLSFSPWPVVNGSQSTGTATLSAPAPQGGALIQLSMPSYTPDPCVPVPAVPSSVLVPEGGTSAKFTANTFLLSSTTWVHTANFTVTASYAGTSSSSSLSVRQPNPVSLAIMPTSVSGGKLVQGKITLDGPLGPQCTGLSGPATPYEITLKSDNTLVAQVPAEVVPTAGATQATFPITTSAVSQSMTVTISANLFAEALVKGTLTLTP